MLDPIRQNAQSWGVKIAFALIIIVFVFWGVGSMSPSQNSAVLATVNEEPIMIPEFRQAFEQQFAMLKRQIPGLKQEDLKQLGLAQQVMQKLVAQKLVLQEAESLGLAVTPQELKKTIASISAFHNDKGVFDGAVYKRVLGAQGMTPGQFEESYRQDLLMQKVQQFVGLPAAVTDEEAHSAFEFAGERRSIEYAVLSATSFATEAKVDPAAVTAFYEEHKDQFKQPALISVDYILVTPKSLAKPSEISEAEVTAFYKQNADTYFIEKESVHARHILVLADANAPKAKVDAARAKIDSVLALVKKGGDFGALAKKYSEGPSAPNGGDLGSFGRGDMVKPFEEAAFALKPGQTSEVIRTQFGFHIIKVEEHTPSRVKSLAEVHDEIRRRLAEDKAADKVADTVDVVFDELMAGKAFADTAKAHDLELRSTPEFPRAKTQEMTGIKGDSTDLLFNTPASSIVDSPLEVDGGYILARVNTSKPEGFLEFAQVKPAIEGRLLQQAALQLAGAEAKKIAPEVTAGKLPKALAESVKTSPLFSRRGFIPGIGQTPELVSAAFGQTGDGWAGPFMGATGAVFFRLKEVQKPTAEEWTSAAKQVKQAMLRNKQQELFRAFIDDLMKKGEVEVLNQEFLDKL